ncbi:MAG: Hsp20/alpha crystallin family protein [Syntrophaceae bacterium]|nr:Hsp20/alpha crystallin family protein [Syntrophaceae bacterium]
MFIPRGLFYPTTGFGSAFEELERMRRDMDRLLEGFSGRAFLPSGAGVFPLVNLTEDKDAFYVRAELPGVKSDELNISATANTLSITGERKLADEGKDVRYHRREREAGSFSRIISLPGEVDADRIEADLKNGMLTIRIPKAEAAKPKQITVK